MTFRQDMILTVIFLTFFSAGVHCYKKLFWSKSFIYPWYEKSSWIVVRPLVARCALHSITWMREQAFLLDLSKQIVHDSTLSPDTSSSVILRTHISECVSALQPKHSYLQLGNLRTNRSGHHPPVELYIFTDCIERTHLMKSETWIFQFFNKNGLNWLHFEQRASIVDFKISNEYQSSDTRGQILVFRSAKLQGNAVSALVKP